jgi:GT2 family glycosyltransferase
VPDNSSQEAKPKIGVVIVNYNNFNDTIKYINNCLRKQLSVDLTIAVVDNDSDNDSFSRLQGEFRDNTGISLIRNISNTGYSGGNNLGIHFLEKSGCEFILISNNDIEFEDVFLLKQLTEEYRKLKNVAFIAPVMLVNGKLSKVHYAWKLPDKMKEILSSTYLLKLLGYFYLKKFYYSIGINDKSALNVECLAGSFFLGSSSAFKEAGYFDENIFLYYEETLLGHKVKKINKNNYLIQGIFYNHFQEYSINTKYSIFQKHRILLESKTYYWKNYCNAGFPFLSVLKFLYYINLLETFIIKPQIVFHEKAGK